MKSISLFTLMLSLSIFSVAQTKCTSNGGNNWSTAFTCTGSGTPVVYEILAGDSVYCDVTSGTSIDSMIVRGTLSFENKDKIDMASGSIVQVYSGGNISGGDYRSKFRFATATNVVGTFNVSGPAWTDGGAWEFGAVPVTWLDLSAERTNDIVNVYWSTATEINNRHFEIEISFDGANWELHQVVASKSLNGNSSEVLEYSTELIVPNSNSKLYVRVKQLDFDGSYDYSKVVRVEAVVNDDIKIENLGSLRIAVVTASMESVVKLVDIHGKEVPQTSNAGERFEYDFPNAGIYIVEVVTGRKVEYKKILIH